MVRTRCGETGCVNPVHMYKTRSRGVQKQKDVTVASSMDKMVRALRDRVLVGELGSSKNFYGDVVSNGGRIVDVIEAPIDEMVPVVLFNIDDDEEGDEEDEEPSVCYVRAFPIVVIERVLSRRIEKAIPEEVSTGKTVESSSPCGDESEDEFDADEWLERLREYDGFDASSSSPCDLFKGCERQRIRERAGCWEDSDCEEEGDDDFLTVFANGPPRLFV